MEANIWTANIQTWLDSRKNASLGLLAKRADIPYPTLRRVFQGERKPSYATAVKIAFETMPSDEAINILEKDYGQPPSMARALLKNQAVPVSAEDGKCIAKTDELIISGMALAQSGTTRAAVFNRLGNDGVEKLNRLVDRGIVTEWNGRIHPQSEQRFLTDYRDIVTRAKLSLDLHTEDTIGTPGSFGYFGMGGLNETGRERVQQALMQARDAITEVFKDESASGDLVLAVTMSSVFISE
ncbi:MAG TPA: helix-turn-helix transcriptional regulator [Oligoflexus sp.]|uniref:helix-turn-helix domain-containing protein n=1 Tax=Oligoflexus sp. TaxID=1971216 RepID=UPI002D4891FC|nr:helix-turn-helix transcriptional regulator [Oligoflexus sp.]HYX35840.1 helix-turn-helix transcriptional regulator [Oligoflexus sp.]